MSGDGQFEDLQNMGCLVIIRRQGITTYLEEEEEQSLKLALGHPWV